MKNSKLQLVLVLGLVTALGFVAATGPSRFECRSSLRAAEKAVNAAPDEAAKAAIQKQGEAFVEAFHKGDAKALAALLTVDCDHIDQSGQHLKGRDAIEKEFATFFAENRGLKVGIESNSLRFLTPEVAIEDGTTEAFAPNGGPPSQSRFTNIHVKRDGQWLLSGVRIAPLVRPSNYEHLRVLEWAIGDWAGEAADDGVERLAVAWADNQNFIKATFSATLKNVPLGSATHQIGWDPVAKRLRSWVFDATGGFGEGSWVQDGKKWVVKTTSVLQDGKQAAATYTLAPVNSDAITLKATERSEDGKKLPDIKEIKLKRVK
jgi:uncharacterized protein (TIGR02246 family)